MFPDVFLWQKWLDYIETNVAVGASFTQIVRPRRNRLAIRFDVALINPSPSTFSVNTAPIVSTQISLPGVFSGLQDILTGVFSGVMTAGVVTSTSSPGLSSGTFTQGILDSAFITTIQDAGILGGFQVTPITGMEFTFLRWGPLIAARWYGRAIGTITSIHVTELVLKSR